MSAENKKAEWESRHKAGDLFVERDEIHVLEIKRLDFTPADTPCEEYIAICGAESQSWAMSRQGIKWAEFIDSVETGLERGFKKCSAGCFEDENSSNK